jgi:hypothetical protein
MAVAPAAFLLHISMVEKTSSASSDGSACAAERLENGHADHEQRLANGQMIAWSPFI